LTVALTTHIKIKLQTEVIINHSVLQHIMSVISMRKKTYHNLQYGILFTLCLHLVP